MSDTNPENNPEAVSNPAVSDTNTSASMVTPKNQVVLEPQAPTATSQVEEVATPLPQQVEESSQVVQQAPDAAASTEVSWPDMQDAAAGVVESEPNQAATVKSSSKVGLIVGLLVLLALLIGVYVALSKF